jgi:addiction module HigA family antidote
MPVRHAKPKAMNASRMPTDYPALRRRRAPTHPGALIREILEEHLRLTVSDAARRLRVTRQSLHAVLAGRAAVTPEMALRLGRLFGKPPELWLRMQQAHDLWQAERRIADDLKAIAKDAA